MTSYATTRFAVTKVGQPSVNQSMHDDDERATFFDNFHSTPKMDNELGFGTVSYPLVSLETHLHKVIKCGMSKIYCLLIQIKLPLSVV